jgi:hypothetical protein
MNTNNASVTVNVLDLLRLMTLANRASNSACNADAHAYTRILKEVKDATSLMDKEIIDFINNGVNE